MTIAVDMGRKATKTNKQTNIQNRTAIIGVCPLWDHIQNSSVYPSVSLSGIIIRTAQCLSECVLIQDHIQNSIVFHQSVCLSGIIFRTAQCSSQCVLIWDHIQNSTVFT